MSTDVHYSRVAAQGDLEDLKTIAESVVESASVRVVSPPSGGMVMVRHVDPLQHTPFYLGEAQVTECEVEVDGALGYGCVLAGSDERALYAAIIDAVLGASVPNPVLRDSVARAISAVGDDLRRRRDEESARTAATRVDFEVR
jgi:alpha-D-ribose 1-methylphosphonate 5-triphosphate synthase subunit PhnG